MKTTRLIVLGLLTVSCFSINAQDLVKDIYPGAMGSISAYYPSLVNANGTLYFYANYPPNGTELWKSDGTDAGTVMVKDIGPGTINGISSVYAPANVNGTIYFAANDNTTGIELWKSDGTEAGTVMIKDIRPGSLGSMSLAKSPLFTNVNGILYFVASDGINGEELWKSDGTDAGTAMVKDIKSGSGNPDIKYLTNVNGILYFAANGELWKSDGSEAGTVMVKDINTSGISEPSYLTNANGTLYFQASGAFGSKKLLKSDGTDAGTVMVSSNCSDPKEITDVNGTVYFSADNNGRELWKSDGTAAGTVMVKNINPSGASNPSALTNVNGALFFKASDGTTAGIELWKSDGTEGGTVMVKDINTSFAYANSNPSYLINFDNSLFFQADNGINGSELWKSDGTGAGTVMVKDINTAAQTGSSPKELTNVNGTLYFVANNGTNGVELWKLAGTTSVREISSLTPKSFSLAQNYPNPFNPTTTIRYDIPKIGFVKISVYNILGKEIKTLVSEERNPGSYEVTFEANGLASGIYYYTIRTGDFTQSRKMILMK